MLKSKAREYAASILSNLSEESLKSENIKISYCDNLELDETYLFIQVKLGNSEILTGKEGAVCE